ncbi:hypothetical protein POM88_011128 [Heracleum sosnowskyi]|uniref:F-box domain-containing protein n=1 Tax=Heracleum sosnowskyi TaxID=360622 RepID=A0AAD8N1A8_9APIA|nr:hypothetical protein POM88_011128 [Heracleum sosnowskyi]
MPRRSTLAAVLLEPPPDGKDLISELPDECSAIILQRVRHRDLKSCTLVCRKWLFLQGSNHRHLSLCSKSISITSIPFLFSRFDSVTKLVIRCTRRSDKAKKSLSNEELELISIKCTNLTTFKLFDSTDQDVTDVGMAALGTHATRLKKFSCRDCYLGVESINALLSSSSSLEVISIRRYVGSDIMLAYPGAAASSLKSISLDRCFHYGYCYDHPIPPWFAPLLIGSKNLTSLKIKNCLNDLGDVINMVANRDNSLVEVYLDKVDVSEIGFSSALSNFSKLEILHVTAKYPVHSLDDEALSLISTKCCNLTTLKLRKCYLVTHNGMADLGRHATRLKKFSCRKCKFGGKGLNALLCGSSSLQEISVKDLHGDWVELIYPGAAASSLKSICLKDLYNHQSPHCFAPLITGSKNLTSLRLLRCVGNWDNIFSMLEIGESNLYEVYLKKVPVTDAGLSSISSFSKLEILHLLATPNCTSASIVSLVKQCKSLRKLHVDKRRTKWNLGEDGLFSIGKYNAKLQVVKHRTKIRPFWQNLLIQP